MSGGGDLRRTLRMFGRYTLGQRRSFVYAMLMLGLEAATAVALPFLLGALTDLLVRGKQPEYFGYTPSAEVTIYLIAAGIILATVVNSSSASVAEINLATAGRTLGFNLRGALFGHLQRLPLAFHIRRSTGDVLTRITGDVKAMEDFVQDSVADLVGSFFVLGVSLWALFAGDWRIGLVAVAVVPLMAGVSNFFARRIKSASKQERASEGELASTAQEMLSAISLVQVYGRGDLQERKFAEHSRSARDAMLRTSRLEAFFSFAVAVIESVGIAVLILVGYQLVTGGALTPGQLIFFIGLIQGMFKPIRRIIKQWNKVSAVYASVERVDEILDRQPTVVDAPDARPAPELRGEIEFRDVSFAYESPTEDAAGDGGARLALHSVNFRMAAGEAVALVGHSGAGKSTIAQLLPRLYDPHAGAVLVDGRDIRGFTIGSLRAQMSMVLQETVLLRGTVAENIAYGREGATREEVIRAATFANAHDFVMDLPDGYDTVLGERAATLSGGQRQRLAIARAFVRDAPILIMDEPTTGLDAESAAQVADTLKTLARNRSTVIVSHDLNLIRSVDRVLVISAGRILEDGSPEDLLASGGLYAELYAKQFGEAIAAVAGPVEAAVPAPRLPEPVSRRSRLEEELQLDLDGVEPAEGERFDTVLVQALPRPASRDEFTALTGWLPAIRLPAQEQDELDPLRSPGLVSAVPGLTEALSGAAMAPRLQRMLADGWELLTCTPAKALVEPGEGAGLQYRLELRRRATGETVQHLVAGRLFRTVEDAERWRRDLDGPVARLEGRDDLRAFAEPAVLLPDLRLVLHAFPLDPTLPGLITATDPRAIVEMLGPVLTSSVPGLVLNDCRAETVKYARGSCVLRYELDWRLQPSRRSLKQVVYGKVYEGGQGQLVGPALTALREQPADGARLSLPFLVPRFQAYLPELRLALLDAVPGSPLLSALIRAREGAPGARAADGPPLEVAIAACARSAAALHRTSIPVGAPRTLADEIDGTRTSVDDLAPLAPELAVSLHRHLDAVADAARDRPEPPGVAHGDLQPSQVLFDGPTTALVDWDTVCRAEPALDLGEFTANLAVAVRKARDAAGAAVNGGEDLGSAFLRDYVHHSGHSDPDVLLGRVAAYRRVALVRIAVRSWCRLKPERLRPTLALLDEPQRIRVP
jgi:ABC-type multidrug transport system fused ATPase/permease subunit